MGFARWKTGFRRMSNAAGKWQFRSNASRRYSIPIGEFYGRAGHFAGNLRECPFFPTFNTDGVGAIARSRFGNGASLAGEHRMPTVELSDVFDFHTDIRFLVLPEDAPHDRIPDQLDLPTCRGIRGVVSATGRLLNVDRQTQWAKLEAEVSALRAIEGLTLFREAADLTGSALQVLHAEGIYFLEHERQLDDLDRLWEMGFRSLGPLYNEDNPLGGGARGDGQRGLTPLGRRVFELGWERGFLMDCAHCNHRTQADVIDLALELGRPLHFSHGLLDEPHLALFGERGLPRAHAERLLTTGGLVGLSPHPGFYGTFARYLDEIAWLAERAPGQTVLGSDFTGIITPPETFPEYPSGAHTPEFAEQLAERHGADFARDFCGRTVVKALETMRTRS